MKRKIKDFSKFVNEELDLRTDMYAEEETETMPVTKPVTRPRPNIQPIPSPEPGTESDPQAFKRYRSDEMPEDDTMDFDTYDYEDDKFETDLDYYETEEEEGTYIGDQLMQELSNKLGAEIVDGEINYQGHKINFYSETEAFDVDGESYINDSRGKKVLMKTPDDVMNYLESKGSSQAQAGSSQRMMERRRYFN